MALLDVAHLSRTFDGLKAVSDLSFSVEPQEIVGLIGPNGAGKSTVVNLVSGATRPSQGSIHFKGEDVTSLPTYQRARRGLVRTFQSTAIYPEQTVRENALRGAYLTLYPGFFATLMGSAEARRRQREAERLTDELLDWLGLSPVADTVSSGLPYGYQKSLGIVVALAARPQFILLDEPVAGLSAQEADHVRDTIKRVRDGGVTVIVIDHNMRFIAGLCDRVVVLHHGQELAQGAPQEVLKNPRVIEAYLGHSHVAHTQ
jgi:branched-chain amino acid transport system ATP-binding protein